MEIPIYYINYPILLTYRSLHVSSWGLYIETNKCQTRPVRPGFEMKFIRPKILLGGIPVGKGSVNADQWIEVLWGVLKGLNRKSA